MQEKKLSIWLLLGVGFLDSLGFGLVFPIFSVILFSHDYTFVAHEVSDTIRGGLLGILIGFTPLVQFFASPILGMFSDQKGRKSVLLVSLAIGCVAYAIGIFGIAYQSLTMLIIYRALFGVSSASFVVVQASIADLSTASKKVKTKNFGLYGMAQGLGFTLGPFLGGNLSVLFDNLTYKLPFIFAAGLTLINLVLLYWKFEDTHRILVKTKLNILLGFQQLKRAFKIPELSIIFLTMFIFWFGWDFFVEFVPVFLLKRFHFDSQDIGNFYGYMGAAYAICTGFLIRLVTNRFQTRHILLVSMLFAGISIIAAVSIYSTMVMLIYVLIVNYSIALIIPNAMTEISTNASEEAQGEILGIYGSIQSLALIVSPLFSGFLIGWHYTIPVIVGGSFILIAGIIFLIGNRRRLAHM